MSNQNGNMELGLTRPVPDALALEYKGEYGTARRDLNIADLVNNPAANGECRVLCLGLEEKSLDLLLLKGRPLGDDSPDPALI